MSWRLREARRIEAAYDPSPNVVVFAVAGSVGAGLADRWSDLEVDCYWREPPSDEDRRRPIRVLGAELTAFWEFDQDDEEWSEDYRLGPLPVTISNFTVAAVEGFLTAVLHDGDLDPVRHYRLAAISNCEPLRGAHIVDAWRQRIAGYPDALVVAVVEAELSPDRFPGWSARQALAERSDSVAVYSLVSAMAQGISNALLAINRVFKPHRLPKWQRARIGLPLQPKDFHLRLEALWSPRLWSAVVLAEELLYETIDLAEGELGLRLDATRAALADERAAIEPPDAGGASPSSYL